MQLDAHLLQQIYALGYHTAKMATTREIKMPGLTTFELIHAFAAGVDQYNCDVHGWNCNFIAYEGAA